MSRKIAEIEARERAATKGPWTFYFAVDADLLCDCSVLSDEASGRAACVFRAPNYEKQAQWEANAGFACAAREDIPALCAALRIAVGFIRDEACSLKIAEDEANCCRAHEALREIAALIEVEE